MTALCSKGIHELTAANTHLATNGQVQCRECNRLRSKAWREKNRDYKRAYDRLRYRRKVLQA
jgi:hypothetical protein